MLLKVIKYPTRTNRFLKMIEIKKLVATTVCRGRNDCAILEFL